MHPVVAEFQELVDTDPIVRMYLEQMVHEVPAGERYRNRHLRDVPQLLRLVNTVLTTAPEYGENMVTTPLGAILDWTTATRAGFSAYRDRRVNAMLAKVLDTWCEFLDGPDCRYVLNDSPSGWRCEAAEWAIGIEQFEYDPDDEYWGFGSWNACFPAGSVRAPGRSRRPTTTP